MVGFKGLVRLWLRVYGWLSRVYVLVILWFRVYVLRFWVLSLWSMVYGFWSRV